MKKQEEDAEKEELKKLFLVETKEKIREIEEALEKLKKKSGDVESMEIISMGSHSLAGSLLTLGNFKAGYFATKLEQVAKTNNIELISSLFESLKDAMKHNNNNNNNKLSPEERAREMRKIREINEKLEKVEEERKESEEKFRTIFENAPIGMTRVSVEGKFLDVNPMLCEILGYNREELKKKSVQQVSYSDEHLKDDVVALKKMAAGKIDNYGREKKYIHKNGKIIDVIVKVSAVRDEKGALKSVVTMIEDITEQKKSEDELRKQKAFLNSIVENIPDMVFVKDAKEFKFEEMNKSGQNLLGLSKEKILGKTLLEKFSKSQSDFFLSRDREVIKSKKLLDIPEEPINTPQGLRILHTKKIPLFDENGKPEYLLGISEDITERKKAEEKNKKGK